MQNWHHDRRVDIGLRAGGVLLCGLSYLAVRWLVALQLSQVHGEPGVEAFALAAVAFLCGSCGTALLTLGHHIFDEVAISQRWRTAYLPPLATPSTFGVVSQPAEPAPQPPFNWENQRAPHYSRCA